MQKQNIWSYALRINRISGKEVFNILRKNTYQNEKYYLTLEGVCSRISFKHNATLGLWQKDLTLITDALVCLLSLCFSMHNGIKSLHIFFYYYFFRWVVSILYIWEKTTAHFLQWAGSVWSLLSHQEINLT